MKDYVGSPATICAMPQNKEADHVRQKIKNWLVEQDYRPVAKDVVNKIWAIEVYTNAGDFGCTIAMDAANNGVVKLACNLPIEEYESLLNGLTAPERKSFLFDLRFRLAALDLQSYVPLDGFSTLSFQAVIFKDELSKSRLFKSFNELHRAVLLSVWSFQQRFDLSDTNGDPFNLNPSIVH